MVKHAQRQALATTARLSSQLDLPGFPGRAVTALWEEAARILADDEKKRSNGGTSMHIVGQGGALSGFIKDANTTIRFGGGAVAVTTHD
jgi:hypothetical protein